MFGYWDENKDRQISDMAREYEEYGEKMDKPEDYYHTMKVPVGL